jgi:hypothetical protein
LPWFEAAVAAFGEDLEISARELDERFERCWPLYFAEPDSSRSRGHITQRSRRS